MKGWFIPSGFLICSLCFCVFTKCLNYSTDTPRNEAEEGCVSSSTGCHFSPCLNYALSFLPFLSSSFSLSDPNQTLQLGLDFSFKHRRGKKHMHSGVLDIKYACSEWVYFVVDSRWISCNIDGRLPREFVACFCWMLSPW